MSVECGKINAYRQDMGDTLVAVHAFSSMHKALGSIPSMANKLKQTLLTWLIKLPSFPLIQEHQDPVWNKLASLCQLDINYSQSPERREPQLRNCLQRSVPSWDRWL